MSEARRVPAPEIGPQWCPTAGTSRCENPAVMILFGATGDLTRRKLMPAIYSLTADDLLPCGLPIICVGRSATNREELCQQLRAGVEAHARRQPIDDGIWEQMLPRVQYVRGDLHDQSTYKALAEVLNWADGACGCPMGRLFYLATPPEYFPALFRGISTHGLATGEPRGDRWTRLVIEKPFGHDLESAQALNELALGLFSEEQILRMDHYLGKETVQNIAVFRFANSIFEPLWNERHIDNVQITMAETVGLEGRGSFFESAGMLRDVVQNHVLEMLCLVAMEPPVSMDADAIRDEKLKVLRSLHRMTPEEMDMCVVRGRYGPGTIDGEEVPGYLSESHVAEDSTTETYVALRLHVDNWRWAGVPFYIRAGKRLARRVTEIVVNFRPAPHLVFEGHRQGIGRNSLVLRVQPDEGVRLSFSAKRPGPGVEIEPVPMDFHYARTFAHEPPEAYERLILDALTGDHTLFARGDAVEASWEWITPILKHWENSDERPAEYEAGSWGPEEADRLIAWTADRWHVPA
jgi:glucose-6-phosphate 1-dehydrogenase